MLEASRRHKRVGQMGSQWRSCKHIIEAAELVRSGKLGKISLVRGWAYLDWLQGIGKPPDGQPPAGVDYDFWLGPAPKRPFNPNRFHWNYLYFWDYSGGMTITWGIHMLDSVRKLLGLGLPKAVSASGGRYVLDDMRETPDTLISVFEYPKLTVTCSVQHAN